jgi:hypothetical protein
MSTLYSQIWRNFLQHKKPCINAGCEGGLAMSYDDFASNQVEKLKAEITARNPENTGMGNLAATLERLSLSLILAVLKNYHDEYIAPSQNGK